jgi:predicted CopG family antitoxin
MARSVSLSDKAFRILRSHKGKNESDSDVVIRLAHEARSRVARLEAYLRNPPRHDGDWERHERFLEEMRKVDIQRMREAAGGRA